MPRKSQDALGPILPGVPRKRSPPPPELDPREAKIWRDITRSLPADWFTSGNHLLLKELCRHVRLSDDSMVDIALARAAVDEVMATPKPPPKLLIEALKKYRAALQSHALQSERIASLSTKLRITNQSRYAPRVAGTAANTVSAYPEPWIDWNQDGAENLDPDAPDEPKLKQ